MKPHSAMSSVCLTGEVLRQVQTEDSRVWMLNFWIFANIDFKYRLIIWIPTVWTQRAPFQFALSCSRCRSDRRSARDVRTISDGLHNARSVSPISRYSHTGIREKPFGITNSNCLPRRIWIHERNSKLNYSINLRANTQNGRLEEGWRITLDLVFTYWEFSAAFWGFEVRRA